MSSIFPKKKNGNCKFMKDFAMVELGSRDAWPKGQIKSIP
jgi:hypothetical protein